MNKILGPLVALACLFGCGGSSGGGTPNCSGGAVLSSLGYTTSWSNGQSQVIVVTDPNGGTAGTRVLNRSASEVSFSLSNLSSGRYRVIATLYSGANGTGTVLGDIRALVDVCDVTSFRSATSGTLSSVQVTPASFSMTETGAQQFYAYGKDGAGTALFTAATDFTYSVTGGIANVTADGLVTASNDGTGAVVVSHGPSSIVGNASLTVTPSNISTGKWTVLVYMNAANDLYPFSTLNMNQMEEVASNSSVRFVVQWKQSKSTFPSSSFDGTRRVLVTHDTGPTVVSPTVQDMGTNVDMGDWQTLKDFVTWGKQFYPADHYVLVVWNHGNGWLRSPAPVRSVSYDDQTGNSIKIWELKQALATQRFDIIAWDASLMQMLEVAYECKDNADFVAGSEESPPGEGYPYHLVFAPFRDNPLSTPRQLSKGFVDGMMNYTPYVTRKITQSVLDTSKLPALATQTSLLADRMIQYTAQLPTIIPNVRNTSQSYSPTFTRVFRDLHDVCRLLKADSGTPSLVWNAANSTQQAITDAIVWEGHNSNSPGSKGVSIEFGSSSVFNPESVFYRQMAYAQDTHWDEFLAQAP